MKKTILLSLISLPLTLLSAQNQNDSTNYGRNLITGSRIKTDTIKFDLPVYKYEIDRERKLALVQIRSMSKNQKSFYKNGKVVAYDLASKKTIWEKPINYSTLEVQKFGDILYFGNETLNYSRIDLKTGNTLWTNNQVFFATLPKQEIGLGYSYIKNSGALSNKLEAIDLKNGNKLWERVIDKKFGWNGFSFQNDSCLLIKSSGLHQLNLRTGKGWDYESATGISAYQINRRNQEASVSYNEIVAAEKIKPSGYDLLSNLTSNLAEDKVSYYLASKNTLARISHEGKVVWSTDLDNETSSSHIITDNSTIYLINKGLAKYNNADYRYGKPYIAAFDKKNGSCLYIKKLNTQGNPLIDFKRIQDKLQLFFADRAIMVNLQNGNTLETLLLNYEEDGRLEYLLQKGSIFIKTGNKLEPAINADSDNCLIKTTKQKAIELSQNLKTERTILVTRLYYLMAETPNFSIYSRNNDLFIVDKDGKMVAILKEPESFDVYDEKIYYKTPVGIVVTDLNQLRKKVVYVSADRIE